MQDKKVFFFKKIEKEARNFSQRRIMVKGTVYKVYRRCGNKNCKCAKGERHEGYQLNYKGKDNITKTIYVRKEKVKDIKKLILNYRKAKKSFNKIIDLNFELLKIEK